MSQIPILDPDGRTILYASLTREGKLFFEFELYARNDNEGDYEFNHTVEPDQFELIATMFDLNPTDSILTNIQKITDSGRGEDLERALTKNEIKNALWTWLGTPRGI